MEGTISIEGTLLMLDNATPHVAVPVQAICGGEVIATTLSDKMGRYQFGDLKRERYQVRCQVLGGYVYYGEGGSTVADESRSVFLQVKPGATRESIDFRFAPFKKGTWRTFTTLDGLAHNAVTDIHRDADGVMWFATRGGGVSVYDGKGFLNLTTWDGLGNSYVASICSGPDGSIWFATSGSGVFRYDGKEFLNFTTRDGLASNWVNVIYRDPSGVMWFGTYDGISCYDGREFTSLTAKDGSVFTWVNSICHGPPGMMWFGVGSIYHDSKDSGIFRYDGKELLNFTTRDGLAGNAVRSIHYDPDGVMWFATEKGVSRYDGEVFVNFTIQDGLVCNDALAIHRDSDGTMWFATRDGVSRYDDRGMGDSPHFVNFTTQDGLVCNWVNAIHRDPSGMMWFATEEHGISRYDEETFVNFTIQDGLPDNVVRAIQRDPDGTLWFGSMNGASRYDGKGFVNLTTRDGLIGNDVWSIRRDLDDVIWFATENGISRYDGRAFINLPTQDVLAGKRFWCLHCGPDGVMWFGAEGGGAFRYDGKHIANFTTQDGLVNDQIRAISHDSDGTMWFGSLGLGEGGASRYDGEKFVNFTARDGLAGNSVSAICCDTDGILWFGTWNGVSRYDGGKFVNFNVKDGLAHNYVLAIHRDPDQVMWFGTWGGGVSRYDGTTWTSLDTRDGLAGNDVAAICQDADGFLWFGTSGGVTRYRPGITPPEAYIISVTTDQIYRDLSAIPSLTPGTRVTIEYNSIDLKTVPEKRQYRYRVFETGDVRRQTSDSSLRSNVPYLPPTKETTFDWVPEKPGTYTFQVQAIDRDLNYSEPATLGLTVQPDPVLIELNHLRREVAGKYHFETIIGRSSGIRQVRALMERAIDSGLTVLITGETGTGKELVAKAIHYNSPRKAHPLLDRNCGAIPKELLASDLFGHHKGAFTGAQEDKAGLFEAASGGTVLLDEISEMPRDAQVHLLRVLEERKARRLGENMSRDVDVRIITMTNRDLAGEVEAGRFREDLFFRLSEFPIHVPPLRERPGDIPLLAEHFLQDYSQEHKKELDGFGSGVLEVLQGYPWPGNVRELRNVIRQAAALAEEGERIQTYHFSSQITHGESLIQEILSRRVGYSESVDQFRRRLVECALRECDGNRTQAAKMLGMNRPNLIKLIKRLGIGI